MYLAGQLTKCRAGVQKPIVFRRSSPHKAYSACFELIQPVRRVFALFFVNANSNQTRRDCQLSQIAASMFVSASCCQESRQLVRVLAQIRFVLPSDLVRRHADDEPESRKYCKYRRAHRAQSGA